MAQENPESRGTVRFPHRSPISLEQNEVGILHHAHMFDYSSSGIYFESDFYVPPGTELFIGIKNSPFHSPPGTYECYRAMIRWSRSLEHAAFDYGYGAELVGRARSGNGPRRHPRKACSVPTVIQGPGETARGIIRNVSYGGVFVRCSHAFAPGERVSLAVPHRKQQKIIVRQGEVVWADTGGVGIKFDPHGPADAGPSSS